MPYIEQLIEALSEAERTNSDWWESFDSIEEASAVISNAILESPDEYEIMYILDFAGENGIYTENMHGGFKHCLRRMKKKLKSMEDEDEDDSEKV